MSEDRLTVLAEVARALSWPPHPYSAAAGWCPNCDFQLNRTEHHQRCLGYIVGGPDMPLCACPCQEARRAAAARRKPDAFYDKPQWWQALARPEGLVTLPPRGSSCG